LVSVASFGVGVLGITLTRDAWIRPLKDGSWQYFGKGLAWGAAPSREAAIQALQNAGVELGTEIVEKRPFGEWVCQRGTR
jgi:hypothetical protein